MLAGQLSKPAQSAVLEAGVGLGLIRAAWGPAETPWVGADPNALDSRSFQLASMDDALGALFDKRSRNG